MKRLLAVFLALSMLITSVPLSALAAPDDHLAQSAVEQADTSKEELLRQIASDPLLRAPSVQTAQQRDEAAVDTSDTSVTATNGFGRLLLDGIDDSVNGTDFSGANRVIGIKINDAAATVEFVAAETADLVVAIYTDDNAQEMVASGTVEVQATTANTGSTTVVVPLTGTIPNYFTAKGYLLDKAEHAPLSAAYLSSEHTKAIEEIKNATIEDFPEEKVINLDADPGTNFAVVADGVVRAAEGENDAADAQRAIALQSSTAFNNVLSADADTQTYVIENPSNRVKYLRSGQILVLEYDGTNMIVTRVKSTEQNGNVITIHGDLDFDLEDAFDFLKLEEQTGGDKQYQYVAGTGDAGLTYLGQEYTAGIDEMNALDINIPINLQSKFKLSKPGTIDGSITIGMSGSFKFYLSAGKKEIALSAKAYGTGSAKFEQTRMEVSVPLGVYEFSPIVGIDMSLRPTFKFSLKTSVTATFSIESTAGFEWTNYHFQPTSTDPYIKFEVKLEGEVFLGLDLEPNVKVFSKVAEVKFTAQLGATMKFTRKAFSADTSDPSQVESKIDPNDWYNSPTSYHACANCYEIGTGLKLTIGMTISLVGKVVSQSSDINIPLSVEVAQGHYSADYSEFTLFGGKCKHDKYRIVVSMDKADSAGTKIYYSKNGGMYQGAGELNSQGWLQIFLEPGTYTFSTVPDNKAQERYYCTFAVTDAPLNPLLRYATRSGVCGAEGSSLTWEISDSGMLSISGTGEMQDYSETNPAPWPKEEVTGVEIQAGVTSIGSYAFAGCFRMLSANISGTVDTINDHAFSGCFALSRADFSNDLMVLGPYAFENCKKLESFDVGSCLVRLEEGVFDGCTALKTVQLHDIWTIGAAAFRNCTALQELSAPSVLSIEDDAFNGCTGLKTITFSKQLSSFGPRSFYNCTSLTQINIPDGVTVIPQQAFYGCTSLHGILLPDSVTALEDEAFYACRSAAAIRLSDQLASIGQGAFYGCESFAGKQQFTPGGSNTPIATTFLILPETLTFLGDSAFEACTKLDGVKFPEHLDAIGSYAFRNCTSLSQAILPDGLQHFGQAVFAGCTSLTEVSIPHDISRIAVNTFDGCTALQVVHLPAGTDLIADSAFNGCTALQRVEYGGTVSDWYNVQIEDNNDVLYTTPISCSNGETFGIVETVIDSGSCGYWSNDWEPLATWELTSRGKLTICGTGGIRDIPWKDYADQIKAVIIEDGITTIPNSAFANCTNLTSVSLGADIKSIESQAFSNCSSLTDIVLPEHLTSIGYAVFQGCSNLTSIVIPESVTSIGASTFKDCLSLTHVVIPNGVTSIGSYAFAACSSLTGIFLPASVTELGYCTFKDCTNLLTIETPDSIKAIPENLFFNCTSLVSVSLGDNTLSIGRMAFYGCSSLETIRLPKTMDFIGPFAFTDCSSLKNIELPEGIAAINEATFSRCSNLEKISIPSSVTEIQESAFSHCENLNPVQIYGSVHIIGQNAFHSCTSLSEIYFPDGLVEIGNYAFEECKNLHYMRIPASIKNIGGHIVSSTGGLNEPYQLVRTIDYAGSKDAWDQITGSARDLVIGGVVHCETGDITDFGSCTDFFSYVPWTLSQDGTLTISKLEQGQANIDDIPDDIELWPREKVKRIIVEDGIEFIGINAFANCPNLEYVFLADSVVQLNSTFENCTSLTTVSIESLLDIAPNTFKNCTSLTAVSSKNLSSIAPNAFENCTSLTTISSENLLYIAPNAFENCSNLESVQSLNSLARIYNDAFVGCDNLRDLYYQGTMEEWYSGIFNSPGVLSIPRSATFHCMDGDIPVSDIIDYYNSFDFSTDSFTVLTVEETHDVTPEAPAPTDEPLDPVEEPDEPALDDPLTDADTEPEAPSLDEGSTLPAVSEQPDALDTSNAITTTSGVTNDGDVSHAHFTSLTAGEDYAVIVSCSADAPLDGANLLYITQTAASADGTLDVPFRTHSVGDAAYVVVCRRSSDSQGGGTSGGTSGGNTSPGGTAGVTTDGSGGGNGDGGPGGLLAILIGGVVAIVVGIIAMLPAEISGKAERADHTILANADVQLLQNNTVVARTTTAADGSFTLSAKRSDYVLRILYPVSTVDEAGQPITRMVTQDVPVKAPASGLTLTL